MLRGYKIRIYPTKIQENLIWKHIHSCRFIWNYMLNLQIEQYKNSEKHLSGYDMMKLLTLLKKEDAYYWLKDVSAASLQKICMLLANAYISFFQKNTGFPKFKSKIKSEHSYPIRSEKSYFIDNNFVHIEKIGCIKFKTDFQLQFDKNLKMRNIHISCINGKYILSFCLNCENQTINKCEKLMGVDLGIKELAIVAYDNEQIVFHNINKSKRVRELKQKLIHTQHSISRKYEASKKRVGTYKTTQNIEREKAKARKIYTKIANIRHNYLHQITAKLISMAPKRITMENLNIRGMMKNKHLSKAIAEQCFYEFIRQIRYKCEWTGIEFVQVPRFYPSSKTCSHCGSIKQNLKISDRVYVCSDCGFIIDRDYNAAINLMRYEA